MAARDEATRPLLVFYSKLLGLQRDVYDTFEDVPLTGSVEVDRDPLRGAATAMLRALPAIGPAVMADEVREILDGGAAAIDRMLADWWRAPSDDRFFPKAILQPYGQRLAERSILPSGRETPRGEHFCPHCGGTPQLSILQGGRGVDPRRVLLCATCFTTWPFQLVRCAYCGDENETRLSYFHSPAFDHLRVDTCSVCRHYLKTVDLARLSGAVPLVDEVAGAPLDTWARDNGYEKIELNLVGL